MSILEGLPAEIADGIDDLFFDATITRAPATGNPFASPTPDVVTTVDARALADTYSDQLRATGGIPDTHIKILILAEPLGGFTPQNADEIQYRGRAYQIVRVDTDPAQAVWTAEARPL